MGCLHLQHFLGHYKSEEEGARAYDRALLTRKKKDGLLNFPLADYTDLLATLSGTPASEFLKPGQTPCSQGAQPPDCLPFCNMQSDKLYPMCISEWTGD